MSKKKPESACLWKLFVIEKNLKKYVTFLKD